MTDRPAITFPDGFLWGAATASYQIEGAAHEGGRGRSVWDDFAHTEGKVANGHTGDVACDHYHRLDDDLALMADLELQSYRFSISWSRVLPDGFGEVNQEGLDFYRRLVDGLLARGITPNITLFHWDLPSALEAHGGFRSRDTVHWFADYAALIARELGDRAPMIATFNEPWCYAYLGHADGHHAPGLRDDRAAVTVAHHELLAHGLAVDAMRAEREGLSLGIVINPSIPRSEGEPPAPADALRRIDALQNRWWFDAVLTGAYPADLMDDLGPLADAVLPGDLEQIARPIDWIGLNCYFDSLFRGLDPMVPGDDPVNQPVLSFPTVRSVRPAAVRAECTDMGWPITPDGFHELLLRVHHDYPNLPPVYITENGCAYDDPVVGGVCDDQRRIDFLTRYLTALRAAMHDGVDVRGYYQWSLFDNFEWAFGYDKRFGMVHVDFDTLERTPKASAHWYRDVVRHNALPTTPTSPQSRR